MKVFPLWGRLGTFRWRMLAVVLAAQSILIFFGALVARGMAIADGETAYAERLLWVGSGVAVLAIVAAGLMRTPVGVTLGWLVQVLTWASAVIVPAMIGVGLIFTGLWLWCLVSGARIERMMAERAAAVDGSLG